MAKRAEQVDETRRRIVEATVRLHQRIGLRATTVAAVAAEAGVTRLTVYRHFPDEGELFSACSSQWLSNHVPPDPTAWLEIEGAELRLRSGLADLYRFYRGGSAMLTQVYADADVLPEPIRNGLADREDTFIDVLGEPLRGQGRDPLVRAVLGHAVSFGTWRSLCIERGLPDHQAVDIMTILVMMVSSRGRRRRLPGEVPERG